MPSLNIVGDLHHSDEVRNMSAMQPKSLSWSQIYDALKKKIISGELAPGERLPSEPELSVIYGAGRYSVRRALSMLSSEGRLRIEHGRGVFVSDGLVFQYTIDRRQRLFDQLERAGHRGEVVCLSIGDRLADAEIAFGLKIIEGERVHVNEVLLLSDGIPLGIGRSFHPLSKFSKYGEHRRSAPTQRMFYKSYGINEFFREDTFLWSRPATPDEAGLLRQNLVMPVVETHTRDLDSSGSVIGYSTTLWAASRIRFIFPG